ncbi:site-specific integrase [Deinococcus metallilatus]|uniref:Integrase n=1 Tax=Deinococcus metallilatus TaxID=1211322 RepID=A0AAJ5F433_9DEIO|nr:site-specific integrase [Deinococcus metallilatus]MBB5295436.1 integrase [Deinococcus metallilatus]QBY08040.1 site-specific integrase [Deinococcus metallilatus]RXJ12933.1 site-specific integrase [Deinococcus metallilatus]TLK27145.1 site-specific integrase [Deinococcus metallilatus]GMA16114.1 site-specific integrase [Deinococcus metallilatus]
MPRGQGRRSNDTGSVFFREKRKQWVARVPLPRHHPSGKRALERAFKTQKEAEKYLRTAMVERDKGVLTSAGAKKLSQYFEEWLDTKEQVDKRQPSTMRDYRDTFKNHIKPYLGDVRLERLATDDLRHLHAKLRAKGASDACVRRAHNLLKMALQDAVREEILARNVAALVRPPTVPRKQQASWTPEEVQAFWNHILPHPLRAFWITAILTGLRRGELCGLRWRDINFEASELRVEVAIKEVGGKLHLGPPKSPKARRTIPLPDDLLPILREHRETWAPVRATTPEPWQEHDFVFLSRDGWPLRPSTMNRVHVRLCEEAKVRRIRVHDMRRTYVSILGAKGLSLKTISEFAGHADPAFTARVYQDVLPQERKKAAISFRELLGTAAEGEDESTEG